MTVSSSDQVCTLSLTNDSVNSWLPRGDPKCGFPIVVMLICVSSKVVWASESWLAFTIR